MRHGLNVYSRKSLSRLVLTLAFAVGVTSSSALAAEEGDEEQATTSATPAKPMKERVEGAIPEEVTGFKETQERFVSSMDEFEDESSQTVNLPPHCFRNVISFKFSMKSLNWIIIMNNT